MQSGSFCVKNTIKIICEKYNDKSFSFSHKLKVVTAYSKVWVYTDFINTIEWSSNCNWKFHKL